MAKLPVQPQEQVDALTALSFPDIHTALAKVKSGAEAKEVLDLALVELAKERPELRMELYGQVSSKHKKYIGKMLTAEESAEVLSGQKYAKPYFVELYNYLKAVSPDNIPGHYFRPKELEQAGVTKLNADTYRQYLKALGILADSPHMYGKRHYLFMTQKGIEVARILLQE